MSTTEVLSNSLPGVEYSIPPEMQALLHLRAKHLKMLPATAMQALDIAKDPDCGIAEFAAVIERDATLASDILRMANSVLFARGRPVMNLHRAVVRVGIRTCKSLLIASSFNSMMHEVTLEEEWIREMLSRHGFTTALLCLHLNQALNVGFQGEEFAAGLIHDIGRTVLATCLPDRFQTLDPMNFDEGPETLESEYSQIQTTHCNVGAWFGRKNDLPSPLVDVITYHHHPETAPQNRRLVALVATCDHMANHLQRAEEERGYDPSTNPAIVTLENCGVPHANSCFAEIASTVMESARTDALEMSNF